MTSAGFDVPRVFARSHRLRQREFGIAIGAGADVTIESAGIVLVRSDPRDVVMPWTKS
jgi:cation transport ATPase